ncbi:hypothetical protein [Pseudomonas japonica]|uniref:Uncharacterized protein n=1 Tax=Pseudomonas japonica TaxID=256466 RepID=A0A239GWL4_9PSED|nr:hypothetical protein [Pseudomonas japonica]SNS73517.1 hypothetical protein SAMN05444352_1147 [Pseudomonas japonica]
MNVVFISSLDQQFRKPAERKVRAMLLSNPKIHHDTESKTLEIRGAIAFQGDIDFHALELEFSYWPDKSDESGIARLIIKEDKIPRRVGRGLI